MSTKCLFTFFLPLQLRSKKMRVSRISLAYFSKWPLLGAVTCYSKPSHTPSQYVFLAHTIFA